MPSRSSRSRPASLTSLSEPTGSASRAIAMGGASLAIPPIGIADRSQPGARLLVAKCAMDAGLVEGARIQAERGRSLVVAAQIRVEHRRIVRRDRAAHAGRREAGKRVVGERANGPGSEGREW